jgi:hypothetical protein
MQKISEKEARPVTMTSIAREANLYPSARELWTRHPDLEWLSDSVTSHFGEGLPGRDEGSLLKDCLIDAIAAYRRAERDARDPVLLYMEALLTRATDVFDLVVTADVPEGRIQWDPLLESLWTFYDRHRESTVSVVKHGRSFPDEVHGESLALLGVRLMPEYIGRHIVRAVVQSNAAVAA